MNPKKSKEKERRRARKLAEEAWEAADEQNLDLAEKLIRRAVVTQPENPVLWNDQGMLLCLKNKEDDATEAFRTALALAPTYAEPYVQLAALRAKQGSLHDAIRWMEKAVLHAPQVALYADRLEAYRTLLAGRIGPSERVAAEEVQAGESLEASVPALSTWGLLSYLSSCQWIASSWQWIAAPEPNRMRQGCVSGPHPQNRPLYKYSHENWNSCWPNLSSTAFPWPSVSIARRSR